MAFTPDLLLFPEPKIFQAIIQKFDTNFEKSWLKMPGIIYDEEYKLKEKEYGEVSEAKFYLNTLCEKMYDMSDVFLYKDQLSTIPIFSIFSNRINFIIADYALEPCKELRSFRRFWMDLD